MFLLPASLLEKVSPEVNVDSSSDEEVLLLGQPQLLYLPRTATTRLRYRNMHAIEKVLGYEIGVCLPVDGSQWQDPVTYRQTTGLIAPEDEYEELCLCCERPSLLCSCHSLPGAERRGCCKMSPPKQLASKKLFAGCGKIWTNHTKRQWLFGSHNFLSWGFVVHNSFLFWEIIWQLHMIDRNPSSHYSTCSASG